MIFHLTREVIISLAKTDRNRSYVTRIEYYYIMFSIEICLNPPRKHALDCVEAPVYKNTNKKILMHIKEHSGIRYRQLLRLTAFQVAKCLLIQKRLTNQS